MCAFARSILLCPGIDLLRSILSSSSCSPSLSKFLFQVTSGALISTRNVYYLIGTATLGLFSFAGCYFAYSAAAFAAARSRLSSCILRSSALSYSGRSLGAAIEGALADTEEIVFGVSCSLPIYKSFLVPCTASPPICWPIIFVGNGDAIIYS